VEEHTRLHVRSLASTVHCGPGQSVRCLSLTNIMTDLEHRRQGRARRALRALRAVAEEHSHALLIENVVSDHMHALVQDLDGVELPGHRAGRRGCNYWMRPDPSLEFPDLATPRQ
jgi:hypothetical protein